MNNDDAPVIHGIQSRLDRAIDRAVRQMMHVNQRAGFRRRVMARIESAPQRHGWPLSRYGFAAALVAAVLILAVALLPNRKSVPPGPAPTDTARQNAAPAASSSPAPNTASAQPAPLPARPERAKTRPARRLTDEPIVMPRVADVFGGRSGVSAANAPVTGDVVFPPEPDVNVPLEPLSAVPGITITPLVIEPLRIEPLSRPK